MALQNVDVSGSRSGAYPLPTQHKAIQADLTRQYNKFIYYSPQRTSASPRRSHSNSSGHRSNREIPEMTTRAINTERVVCKNHATQTIGTEVSSPIAHHSSGSLLRPQELSFGKVVGPQQKQFIFEVKKPIAEVVEREDDLRTSAASLISALPTEGPAIYRKEPSAQPIRSETPLGRALPPLQTPRLNPPQIRYLQTQRPSSNPPLSRSGSLPGFVLKQPVAHLIQPIPGTSEIAIYDDHSKRIQLLNNPQAQFPERFAVTMLHSRHSAVCAGGLLDGRALDSSFCINASGNLTSKLAFSIARFDLSLCGDGHSTVYLSGGLGLAHSNFSHPSFLDSLCVLDVLADRWRGIGSLPRLNVARAQHASVLHNKKALYVFGGVGGSDTYLPIERLSFDKYAMQWVKIPQDPLLPALQTSQPIALSYSLTQILIFAADTEELYTITPGLKYTLHIDVQKAAGPACYGSSTCPALLKGVFCMFDASSILWGFYEGKWRQRRLRN